MKKLHLALTTVDLARSVEDYSERLGCRPAVVIGEDYALWRTDSLNLSLRRDPDSPAGQLRHLGWEDPAAPGFSSDIDVNGIVWERFSADEQAAEIEAVWPGSGYRPDSSS